MVTHGSEKINDNYYFSTLLLLVISAWKKVMLEAKEGEYRCNISLDYINCSLLHSYLLQAFLQISVFVIRNMKENSYVRQVTAQESFLFLC